MTDILYSLDTIVRIHRITSMDELDRAQAKIEGRCMACGTDNGELDKCIECSDLIGFTSTISTDMRSVNVRIEYLSARRDLEWKGI